MTMTIWLWLTMSIWLWLYDYDYMAMTIWLWLYDYDYMTMTMTNQTSGRTRYSLFWLCTFCWQNIYKSKLKRTQVFWPLFNSVPFCLCTHLPFVSSASETFSEWHVFPICKFLTPSQVLLPIDTGSLLLNIPFQRATKLRWG